MASKQKAKLPRQRAEEYAAKVRDNCHALDSWSSEIRLGCNHFSEIIYCAWLAGYRAAKREAGHA